MVILKAYYGHALLLLLFFFYFGVNIFFRWGVKTNKTY